MDVGRSIQLPIRQHQLLSRVVRLLMLVATVGVAMVGGARVRAQTPQPWHYNIQGNAFATYSFTQNDQATDALARCAVPLWQPGWEFLFTNAQLDSFSHEVSGAIGTPGQYLNLDRPGTEIHQALQCGAVTDDSGQQIASCCSKYMDYTYGYIGTGTFKGSYDDNGHFTATGSIELSTMAIMNVCRDAKVGRAVDCSTVLAGGTNAPETGGAKQYNLGTFVLALDGYVSFGQSSDGTPSYVRITGRLDITNSEYSPWGFKHEMNLEGAYQDFSIDGRPAP